MADHALRPTFAIVIPTHLRPRLVLQAVESALAQTRPFDQVIVVADGLDDPAIAVLGDLPATILAIEHAGVAAARNAGIDAATEDWVCFLDDDDLLHPDYLSNIEDAVLADSTRGAMSTWFWTFADTEHADAELVATDLSSAINAALGGTPRIDMTYLDIEGRSFDLLLERLRGSMSTSAVRRDLLRMAGGFPHGLTCAEDWTMYVNVARLTEWHTVHKRLAFFREHGGTNTRTGGLLNGLMTLRAIRSFWQPSSLPTPAHRALDAYREDYVFVLGYTLDAALASRAPRGYRDALRIARVILPRRRDRMWAMYPGRMRSLAQQWQNKSRS